MTTRCSDFVILILCVLPALHAAADQPPRMGPLRVHPANPRYFTNDSGRAVYLTGSHTWINLQDAAFPGVDPQFDYPGFLSFLADRNHNFFRLWAWEGPRWIKHDSREVTLSPLPFLRTGPGNALDGKPRFDVTRFDQTYFDRLRQRVVSARDRDLYVGVMLFQWFSVAVPHHRTGRPWEHHPFHKANNVNGIDGDPNSDGYGDEVHTLAIPSVTTIQEAYVRKVVDTVNDLDNVIFEISNESQVESKDWQYHMINLIHNYEAGRPKRHLVWMSATGYRKTNLDLFASPAEVVSPQTIGATEDYQNDPPAATGSKVVIVDTDHLWGVGGDATWVWKCFTRGLHPIFMDPYRETPFNVSSTLETKWDGVRNAMGHTLTYANKMNLAAMTPQNDLASTAYCLANPGEEYLVYLPEGGEVTVDLSAVKGMLAVEWFSPRTRETRDGGRVGGGAKRTFQAPFDGDAVLYVRRE